MSKKRNELPGILTAEQRLLAAAIEFSRTVYFPGSYTPEGVRARREWLLKEAIEFGHWADAVAGIKP